MHVAILYVHTSAYHVYTHVHNTRMYVATCVYVCVCVCVCACVCVCVCAYYMHICMHL